MPDRTPEQRAEQRFVEKAAQLWCLPPHRNKVMDVEFAESIALALRAVEQETWRAASEIARQQIGDCATTNAVEAGKNIMAADISTTLSRRAAGGTR